MKFFSQKEHLKSDSQTLLLTRPAENINTIYFLEKKFAVLFDKKLNRGISVIDFKSNVL